MCFSYMHAHNFGHTPLNYTNIIPEVHVQLSACYVDTFMHPQPLIELLQSESVVHRTRTQTFTHLPLFDSSVQ